MKLISSRSSKKKNESNNTEPMPHVTVLSNEAQSDTGVLTGNEPEQDIAHASEFPEAPKSHVQTPALQEESQTPSQPEAPQQHMYPESSLSAKQLEALHKVIGPSAEQNAEQAEVKQKAVQEPAELKIKGRSVVKTVLLVLFMAIILLAAGFAGWYYWWTTHSVFEYELQPIAILDGQSVAPNDFLYFGGGMTGVTAAFQESEFEPVVGFQFVPLTLMKDIRTAETAAVLYVLTPIEYIQHEFSESGMALRPSELLVNADIARDVPFTVRFTEDPLPLEDYPVGEFTLRLAFNDVPFTVMLHVADTTPPTAIAVNETIQIGEAVFPENFVTDIFDASPIASIAFLEEPNVFAKQEQSVMVVVEDAFGNTAVITAQLYILLNQMPPEIEGVADIESEIGTPVLYLQGVTAHDDFGRELEVHVDSSGVDENTVGTYTAIYWVEDYTGLRTEVEVTVHILSVDPEYVNQQVDAILDRIINDGMTQVEKALAIHNWVRWNMARSTTENVSQSLTEETHRALRDRRGDSRAYSSLSSFMLTRAGIENIRVERIPDAETRHHWLLINPDDRGWHHFDPFPTGLVLGDLTSMFTAAEAEDIARRVRAHNGVEDYYTFDTTLHPEVVQE